MKDRIDVDNEKMQKKSELYQFYMDALNLPETK